MLRRVAGRLAVGAIALLLVCSAAFWMSRRMPGDPFSVMASQSPAVLSEQAISGLRRDSGLDRPLIVQYLEYLRRLIAGNWGQSLTSGRAVRTEVFRALPATALLAVAAGILALAGGVSLGTLAAVGNWANRLVDGLVALLTAFPTAAAGTMLIWLFAASWHLLPSFGMTSRPEVASVTDLMIHLILPAVVLSLHSTALLAQAVRDGLQDVLGQDYIRQAVAKGAGPFRVLFKHALRNAASPAATLATIQIGSFLGGVAVVETVFSWPGLGFLLTGAVSHRDYPLILGVVVVAAISFFVIGALGELVQGWLDPRLRDTIASPAEI